MCLIRAASEPMPSPNKESCKDIFAFRILLSKIEHIFSSSFVLTLLQEEKVTEDFCNVEEQNYTV